MKLDTAVDVYFSQLFIVISVLFLFNCSSHSAFAFQHGQNKQYQEAPNYVTTGCRWFLADGGHYDIEYYYNESESNGETCLSCIQTKRCLIECDPERVCSDENNSTAACIIDMRNRALDHFNQWGSINSPKQICKAQGHCSDEDSMEDIPFSLTELTAICREFIENGGHFDCSYYTRNEEGDACQRCIDRTICIVECDPSLTCARAPRVDECITRQRLSMITYWEQFGNTTTQICTQLNHCSVHSQATDRVPTFARTTMQRIGQPGGLFSGISSTISSGPFPAGAKPLQ